MFGVVQTDVGAGVTTGRRKVSEGTGVGSIAKLAAPAADVKEGGPIGPVRVGTIDAPSSIAKWDLNTDALTSERTLEGGQTLRGYCAGGPEN
ncbi:hypothetical protein NLI96_g2826 [Meripilus lineatus]|uniref:Uncharacterized protein n=1 Tax=Meripilus lineatus TaxID=2056292 RepID=A0AAD5YLI3_9APHY|nr:hypothetical protein NLI96_g2826 [Physisporinus lineatus]